MHPLPTTRFNVASKRSALSPERLGAQPFVLFVNTRGWHNRTGRFRAQLKEPEQDPSRSAANSSTERSACLSVDTVDEFALKVGVNSGEPRTFPPGGHWTGELLEKCRLAFTTAEMVEHHLAHDAPGRERPGCPAPDALSTSVTLTTPSRNFR